MEPNETKKLLYNKGHQHLIEEQEKIFISYTSDRGLTSRKYEELKQKPSVKKTTQSRNGAWN